MSEHEALARFHYGCAARHHKVEIRRLWRSRCMMHAQRSPSTGGTLLEAPCQGAGDTAARVEATVGAAQAAVDDAADARGVANETRRRARSVPHRLAPGGNR
jgi:hypothetical protein